MANSVLFMHEHESRMKEDEKQKQRQIRLRTLFVQRLVTDEHGPTSSHVIRVWNIGWDEWDSREEHLIGTCCP